jgi:hypothetical protein
MHHNTHEIMALYAALDADSRAYWLAIGRRMLAKYKPGKRPVLTLLSFGGNPPKELISDGVVGLPGSNITDFPGKPISR